MKPNIKLAETTTPDGERLILYEHDGSYCIRLNAEELMHSDVAESELLLGSLAVEGLERHANPCVLIGGLGLGFTLRSVLDQIGSEASVQVSELMPAVVQWNREFLSGLNGECLDDQRVELFVEDVWHVISRAGRSQYDAVLLDIDNGPRAMVKKENSRLYQAAGLKQISSILKPGGRLAVWSSHPDHGFADRLDDAGFTVKIVPAKLYAGAKRCTYTIFMAEK